MIRGAIFDLDGTLIDSLGAWNTLGEEFLRERGITPPENLGTILEDMTLAGALGYFRSALHLEVTDEEYYQSVDRLMEHRYRCQIPLKPHAEAFLKQLRERGVACCVATASSKRLADAAIEGLGLRDCFNFVLTCGEVGCGKDAPAIYLQALGRLGTSVEETVVFEDSLMAVRTAKRAGLRVAAMEDEGAPGDRALLRGTADYYFTSFAECEVDQL